MEEYNLEAVSRSDKVEKKLIFLGKKGYFSGPRSWVSCADMRMMSGQIEESMIFD